MPAGFYFVLLVMGVVLPMAVTVNEKKKKKKKS